MIMYMLLPTAGLISQTRSMNRFSRYLEHLRFEYRPRVSQRLADFSTYRARRFLKETGPIGVLVDNAVLGHATTHETAWISTGDKLWGPHTIKTGYAARISVHAADSAAREYEHIRYLPGLISLSRHDHVTLDERFYQPPGRFRGYGYCDHNLFEGVRTESIDGIAFPTLGPSRMGLPGAEDQKRQRLQEKETSDPDLDPAQDAVISAELLNLPNRKPGEAPRAFQ